MFYKITRIAGVVMMICFFLLSCAAALQSSLSFDWFAKAFAKVVNTSDAPVQQVTRFYSVNQLVAYIDMLFTVFSSFKSMAEYFETHFIFSCWRFTFVRNKQLFAMVLNFVMIN